MVQVAIAVLATVGVIAALVLIWQPMLARTTSREYREFARALGMTARYRYLLTPGEYLELKIPAGTALGDVRKALPSKYIIKDEEAWSFAWISAAWIIVLGEASETNGQHSVYAELYFNDIPPLEDEQARPLVFVRSDAARSPVRYPRFVASGLSLLAWVVALLVTSAVFRRRQRPPTQRSPHIGQWTFQMGKSGTSQGAAGSQAQ